MMMMMIDEMMRETRRRMLERRCWLRHAIQIETVHHRTRRGHVQRADEATVSASAAQQEITTLVCPGRIIVGALLLARRRCDRCAATYRRRVGSCGRRERRFVRMLQLESELFALSGRVE